MDGVRFGIIDAGQIAHLVYWIFQKNPLRRGVTVADIQRDAAEWLAADPAAADVYAD